MLEGEHDVFDLVINFLNEEWQPQHIVIRLFEASEFYKASYGKKFNQIVGSIWFKELNYCIC